MQSPRIMCVFTYVCIRYRLWIVSTPLFVLGTNVNADQDFSFGDPTMSKIDKSYEIGPGWSLRMKMKQHYDVCRSFLLKDNKLLFLYTPLAAFTKKKKKRLKKIIAVFSYPTQYLFPWGFLWNGGHQWTLDCSRMRYETKLIFTVIACLQGEANH